MFFCINEYAILRFQKKLHQRLRRLSKEEQGKNGQLILETDVKNWWLTGGQLFITKAHGSLEEVDHCDGGAGVIHLGLTLHGKLDLKCWSEGGPKSGSQPALVLEQRPGTVFLSCSSAFRHQVQHRPCPAPELTAFGQICDVSMAVMMRSTLFPHNGHG